MYASDIYQDNSFKMVISYSFLGFLKIKIEYIIQEQMVLIGKLD